MADDPNKRGKDGDTVSWQPYEIDYAIDSLAKEYPSKDRATIRAAVEACKRSIQPSEGRAKLMTCARGRLG